MSLTEQVCWENLFHEIRDRAEPVYAFDANGLLSAALKYRGRKLFDRNATLLWREPTYAEEDDELEEKPPASTSNPASQVYYEDDKNFVFPRIKVK